MRGFRVAIIALLAAPVALAQSVVKAQGLVSDGVAAIGGPVLIGGTDSGGLLQALSVSTDGSFNIGAVVPGVGTTNLGKAEDAAAVSGDTGVAMLGVINTSGGTLAADGDYASPALNTLGHSMVDLRTLLGNALVSGNGASGTGVLRVAQVSDGTGVIAAVTNVATIGTSITPGVSAAHLGKAEDAVHTSGDTGVAVLGVRNDTYATFGADGDYTPINVDSYGRVRVEGSFASGSGNNSNPIIVGGVDGSANVQGLLMDTSRRLIIAGVGTAGTAAGGVLTVQGVASMTPLLATVSQTTATSLKAEVIGAGTAGTANAGVLTVQGIASMTPLLTTPSQATASSLNAEVQGDAAHDAPVSGNPVRIAAYSSAAAPVDVSGDGDAVNLWALRSGALAVNVTAAGALISGDAANGLDVDVTRLSALVTGSAIIGRVGIDQTTPGTTNRVDVGTFPDNEPFNVAQINGVTPLMGNGVTGTGSQRVTIASDNTAFTVNVGTFPDNEPINTAQWGGTAVAGGFGTATAGSPRVVLATDAALPTGENNIGDVDVDSFPAAAVVNAEQAAITADTTLVAAVANTRLMFAQCSESAASAAAAEVILRHGVVSGTCTGNMIGAPINLAANETGGVIALGSIGFAAASGVCADVISGTVTCVAHTKVEATP